MASAGADTDDERFMRLALEEARIAFSEGEVPVGAVLVIDGSVVATARNSRESSADPTGHAEVSAIREAAVKAGKWRLEGATLYVTKEPCPMCAGAVVNARVKRVVFGCLDPKGGAGGSLFNILSDERLNHRAEVLTGVLEEECASLLREFFQARR